jgi:hypothetical protein
MYLIRLFCHHILVHDIREESYTKASDLFDLLEKELPKQFQVELYKVEESWRPLQIRDAIVKSPEVEIADSMDEDDEDEQWDMEDI